MQKLATQTFDLLFEQYGPLMSFAEVARVLRRTPAGLRKNLNRGESWVQPLVRGRRPMGRRVFYATPQVAEVVDGVDGVDGIDEAAA